MAGGRLWTHKELKILKKMYSNNKNKKIADKLNRTVCAIQRKAHAINLNKSKQHLKKVTRENTKKAKEANTIGYKITNAGYKLLLRPNRPSTPDNGYIMEHRLIVEDYLNIELDKDEVVHHKNGDRTDNRLSNLQLMKNSEHTRKHNTGRKYTKETKEKMSKAAKERFADPKDHPSYKEIDCEKLLELRDKGKTIKEICEIKNICKRTYYNKLNKYKEEKDVK